MRHRHGGGIREAECLAPEEYEALFPPAARAILESAPRDVKPPKPPRKRCVMLHRKRRKLMPHDWAFILRESGQRYPEAVRRTAPGGSKAAVRQGLLATIDASSHASVYELRRLKERAEQAERRVGQEALEKRNNLVRATRKEIARITSRRDDGPTKTELAKARADRTLALAVDDATYELLFARQVDSIPVPETPETAETLLPARTGGVDWIRVFPRHDQYSPYLEYAFAGIERTLLQSNSSSAWAYVVRLGDFVEEVERYEASFG